MLVEAYAYEIEAIERAENAHHRKNTRYPNDHWFCPNHECRIPVVPKQSILGNCFFAGLRTLHDIGCEYYNEPTEGDGTGERQSRPPEIVPPIIPNVLGEMPELKRIRFPHGPLPPRFEQSLAFAIKHARKAPIAGTLEEIVTAHDYLHPTLRKQHCLSVQGTAQNYESAFNEIDKSKRAPMEWKSSISMVRMQVKQGNVPGYYFLQSPQWLTIEGRRGPIRLMLSMNNYGKAHPKRYFADLLSNTGMVTTYFTGITPEVLPHGKIHKIELFPHKVIPEVDQLALRPVEENGDIGRIRL